MYRIPFAGYAHWLRWARLFVGVTTTATALFLIGGSNGIPWFSRAPLIAVLLTAAAITLKGPASALFGPMLAYDLVRTGRRNGTIFNRCAYLSCLWLVLYCLFRSWFPELRRQGN